MPAHVKNKSKASAKRPAQPSRGQAKTATARRPSNAVRRPSKSPQKVEKITRLGIRPLEDVRTTDIRKGSGGSSVFSMLSMYLGGISGGFSLGDIPDMKRDPDVAVGLEYLLTPILNAKVTVQGAGEEQVKAQEIFDRFWQHDLETFKDMFTFGYCPAEVRYKKPEQLAVAGQGDQEGQGGQPRDASKQQQASQLEYDGMIPLEPDKCEPYVHEGRLAYIKAYGNITLEGNTDRRPAKGFWLANDPTYSPFIGNSVLPGSWLFWRAKVGMPDSAVEVLLKANYKCAFSGLQVKYPSEDIADEDGQIYDARAEAEWFAENIKAGTNVVLPSETDDQGKPKWDITSYGGQPIDIQKMLPLMDWLTKQIHRGLGVVDDVITKDGNVGSYSRSNVSRQMFLMLALRRARRIAHTFDQMVCRPLMKRNGYAATYKIVVEIPGMEDDDPNGGGIGGLGKGKDGQPGGEGEEGGPLAKLFQQAMEGGDEEGGSDEEGTAKSDDGEGQGKSPSKEMSLASFLGNWREGIPRSTPTGQG